MFSFQLLILAFSIRGSSSFFTSSIIPPNVATSLSLQANDDATNERSNDRRNFLHSVIVASSILTASSSSPLPANAVERAVGAAEKSCRAAGNCLEKGDWDGAVGWNWGGRDRCDATDPKCGPDGQLRDAPPVGEPIPQPIANDGTTLEITHMAQIDMAIGKMERGTLHIGLYGRACPESVAQMIHFLSDGIVTTSKLMLEDGYGVSAAPVSLSTGGSLNVIYPFSRLDFGVANQGTAYAKGMKLNKVPEDFMPQPRPASDMIAQEGSTRSHSVAGLLSIPKNGMGYGGSMLDVDDEAFASSFQITAANVSAMDREGRKVIGQIMDESSMAFLARLASVPTRKGLKGIIPGQNAGPPLVKVTITSVRT